LPKVFIIKVNPLNLKFSNLTKNIPGPESEYNEFERRLKFKPPLKYICFTKNCIKFFKIYTGAQ